MELRQSLVTVRAPSIDNRDDREALIRLISSGAAVSILHPHRLKANFWTAHMGKRGSMIFIDRGEETVGVVTLCPLHRTLPGLSHRMSLEAGGEVEVGFALGDLGAEELHEVAVAIKNLAAKRRWRSLLAVVPDAALTVAKALLPQARMRGSLPVGAGELGSVLELVITPYAASPFHLPAAHRALLSFIDEAPGLPVVQTAGGVLASETSPLLGSLTGLQGSAIASSGELDPKAPVPARIASLLLRADSPDLSKVLIALERQGFVPTGALPHVLGAARVIISRGVAQRGAKMARRPSSSTRSVGAA